MAGIGFELRKILQGRSYSSWARAYGHATLIGSGPWIISILSLGGLGLVCAGTGQAGRLRLFFAAVAHIYCVTLILTGPLQTVLARFAADRQFCHEEAKIFPSLITMLAITAFAHALLGLVLFVGFVEAPPLFQISSAGLMVLASCVWVAGIYLTVLKKYDQILAAFGVGYGSGFLAAWGLAVPWGAGAAMLGLAWGHAILLWLLLAAIHREVGNREPWNLEVVHCFVGFYPLALCGLFYNLGIWSDKIIFWWLAPDSTAVPGFLRESSMYDQAIYLAFPTMAPGMAVFLVKLETGFALKYEEFFRLVLGKATFREIHRGKLEMVEALREGLIQLVKVQGLVSLGLMVMAERVLVFLSLGTVSTNTFQLSLLGVFLLVVFLSLLTILFYLDKLKEAMACSLLFFLLNTTVTLWGLNQGIRWHGFGFVVATGTAMIAAGSSVNYHLRRLEFETFTAQKLYPEESLGG